MARLHEYQGKALLQQHKLAIPKGGVASTPDEARAIAGDIGKPVMVKAQAWVTGRASLGGIKKAATPDQAAEAARAMLGMQVKGFTVTHVLVEEQLAIKREFYAGVIVDDREQAPLVMFSSVGGTGIEEIAAENPDAVASTHVDIEFGLQDYQARNLVRKLFWSMNDESGGQAWYNAEALGEILFQIPALAREYTTILASFSTIYPFEAGVQWALSRLAALPASPAGETTGTQLAALGHQDPLVRGFAALGLGVLRVAEAAAPLGALRQDEGRVPTYDTETGELGSTTVGALARQALRRLDPKAPSPGLASESVERQL